MNNSVQFTLLPLGGFIYCIITRKKKETNIEAIDTTTTTKDHLEKEGHMTREGLGSR